MALTNAATAVASVISSAVAAHANQTDPHPQYARTLDGAIRLPVLDADPAPPIAGVLLYAFDTGSGYELRLIDTLGAVVTVGP